MKRKVFVLIDSPLEQCNKMWLIHRLEEKYADLQIMDMRDNIFELEKKSSIGKIHARVLCLHQVIRVMWKSSAEDVIFCWNHWTGLLMNLVSFGHRNIISYNWLAPSQNRRTKWIYASALRNHKLIAVVNDKKNLTLLPKAYGVEKCENMRYIPDVYEDKIPFANEGRGESDYCFMGGIANRDWQSFLKLAQHCKNVKFVGVGTHGTWNAEWKIPNNVKMFFDIPEEEYYTLLRNSAVVVCLLKEKKVSGLINLLRSVQEGRLILITEDEVTQTYFPENMKWLLVENGEVNRIGTQVCRIMDMDTEEYRGEVERLQQYMKEKFSPQTAAEKIYQLVDEMGS